MLKKMFAISYFIDELSSQIANPQLVMEIATELTNIAKTHSLEQLLEEMNKFEPPVLNATAIQSIRMTPLPALPPGLPR